MQLTVQNVTPQTRRFFVLSDIYRLDIADANAVALAAWQSFLLTPGDSGYTALSTYQVAARSLLPEAQHQTVLVESNLGLRWSFQLDADKAPELLAAGGSSSPTIIAVDNQTPDVALFVIDNNFAPFFAPATPVPPKTTFAFTPGGRLLFYVSVAVVDLEQPIALEADIGERFVSSGPLTAQFRQDNDAMSWRFT
jgi:hypothetical protein